MIDMGVILEGLVQRTTEGRLRWRPSVADDRFITSVDAISVVIAEIRGRKSTYQLDILDAESGRTVESLGLEDTTEDQDDALGRLYVLARRSALDVDSTLQKLAKALEL